jgi:hypothetical protein
MKEYYVLKNSEKDEYIGIDEASGGYPWFTSSLQRAKISSDLADLERYLKMFSKFYVGFEIHKIHLEKFRQ